MKVRETMEVAVLYLGVTALTLYPLGFVALGLQMWKDPFSPYFTFSSVTAKGLPCVIRFVLGRDGRVLDGTPLHAVIERLDAEAPPLFTRSAAFTHR